MIKRIYLLLITLSPLFALANGFILKGSVEGLISATVTLDYVNQTGEDTSVTLPLAGGTFVFKGSVAEPNLATLTISDGWSYNTRFFLENATINVHLVKDAPQETNFTGSASNVVYERLKPGLNVFFANARQNMAAHQQAAASYNKQALLAADSVWVMQQGQWIQSIRKAVAAEPENYAALFFIRWLLFKPDNYDSILSVFMQLSPEVRQGVAGKKLLADFEHLHKILPGQPAPELSGSDTSGHAVRLAAYKGKVILLDFWSSYCGPCRQQNRALISVYQKYHAAGFEIVSLSLDNDRQQWMRAIQTDGMPWPQVSELRGGASATGGIYEISDLPRNVLIDQSGKIYAKDITGAALTDALEGLLARRK